MTVPEELARQVAERARDRCEYCRMHQALQGATFHVEHIIPRSRGGTTLPENLAWACPGCNLRKADRESVPDPESGTLVRLFHPRADRWANHFRFDGFIAVGQTPVGRATALVLDFNHERRVAVRQAEALFGLFPPAD